MSELKALTAAEEKLEDLSGIALEPGANPYQTLINACSDDQKQIAGLYSAHRQRRNAQQKAKFLAPDFEELSIDQHLLRLENPLIEPGFRDERYCMTFWARPPEHILQLAVQLQHMLRQTAPSVWLMPPQRMHMTVLELAFSKTPPEIDALTSQLRPSLPSITQLTHTHRARLVKPIISHDLSAFAVSFLPAIGEEPALVSNPVQLDTAHRVIRDDAYTYHHLRRDAFDLSTQAGISVASRYQVPSAHITLGRFLTQSEHDTPEKRAAWVKAIDDVNAWLEQTVWDQSRGDFTGEWVIGQERGIDVRVGPLWYGGGRTIATGEGF